MFNNGGRSANHKPSGGSAFGFAISRQQMPHFSFFFTALLSLINSLPPDEKLPVPPVAVVGRKGKKRVDVKSAVRERSTSLRHLLSFSPDVTVQSLWITALKGRLSAKRLRLFVSAPFYAFEKKRRRNKRVKMLFVNIKIGEIL